MEAKGVASATPRSHHSIQSTAQRPPSILYERCGIGLSVDGGLGLCVGPLAVTANAEDLLSSTRPPHPPPKSLSESASFSDPGPSLLSATSIIISKIPDPTQLSATPPNSPPTGQTPDPNLRATSSPSSRTTSTIEASTASEPPIRDGLSPTTSTRSNVGGVNLSYSVPWGPGNPPSSTASSVSSSTVDSTPGPRLSQTLPGNVIQHPSLTWVLSASPSGSPVHKPPTPHRRLSGGAIIGIALGALAALLCAVLAFFFLLRRRHARCRSKRMAVESAQWYLEPYLYDGAFDIPSRLHASDSFFNRVQMTTQADP